MQIKSLSICVPTYNRSKNFSELYRSIVSQKNISKFDLELIVVNDGSDDQTEEVLKKLIQINNIKINYIFQKNLGRSFALKKAIQNASKKYLMIMDDDDLLPNYFFSSLLEYNNDQKVDYDNNICGIVFLCSDKKGKILGNKFHKNYFLGTILETIFKYNKKGDFCDITETKIVKNSLYKSIKGEKRAATGLIHFQISKQHNHLFINKAMKIKQYLKDGLSKNILLHKIYSPNYSLIYELLILSFKNISLITRIRCMININRYKLHGAEENISFNVLNIFFLKIMMLFSVLIYFYDKFRIINSKHLINN